VNQFEQTPLAPVPNVPTNSMTPPAMVTNSAALPQTNIVAAAQ